MQRDIIKSQQPKDASETMMDNKLFNQYGNLKATVQFKDQADIKIEAISMKKPIKVKTNFNPNQFVKEKEGMCNYVII